MTLSILPTSVMALSKVAINIQITQILPGIISIAILNLFMKSEGANAAQQCSKQTEISIAEEFPFNKITLAPINKDGVAKPKNPELPLFSCSPEEMIEKRGSITKWITHDKKRFKSLTTKTKTSKSRLFCKWRISNCHCWKKY